MQEVIVEETMAMIAMMLSMLPRAAGMSEVPMLADMVWMVRRRPTYVIVMLPVVAMRMLWRIDYQVPTGDRVVEDGAILHEDGRR